MWGGGSGVQYCDYTSHDTPKWKENRWGIFSVRNMPLGNQSFSDNSNILTLWLPVFHLQKMTEFSRLFLWRRVNLASTISKCLIRGCKYSTGNHIIWNIIPRYKLKHIKVFSLVKWMVAWWLFTFCLYIECKKAFGLAVECFGPFCDFVILIVAVLR